MSATPLLPPRIHTYIREADLSALAKGRGFYRHGVEVECFIDDIKAYSLAVSMNEILGMKMEYNNSHLAF